jgi:hypothetical protein
LVSAVYTAHPGTVIEANADQQTLGLLAAQLTAHRKFLG